MGTVKEELADLYEQNGELTPKLVVDAARDTAHPLHDRFEWDDTVAGEKYRRGQASDLIRSVKVEWVAGPLPSGPGVREFHSVTRADGASYVPVAAVLADDFAKQLVMRQAEREWRQLYRRYETLAEFLGMVRKDIAS